MKAENATMLQRIAVKVLGGNPKGINPEESDQFHTEPEKYKFVVHYPCGAEIARLRDGTHGRWYLEIDREDWTSNDLLELEVILAGWYADEYNKPASEILDIVKAELKKGE